MSRDELGFGRPDEEEEIPAPFAGGEEQRREHSGTRRRLWIILFLCMLAGVTYIAERYVLLIRPDLELIQDKQDAVSVRSLEDQVRKVLDSYGIPEEWVKKRSISLPDADSIRAEWRVSIPRDVPVASVNRDLKSLAEQTGGIAYAVEDVKTAEVAVHIRLHSRIRYSLVFQPNPDLRRKNGRIMLLLDGFEDAGGSDIERFLASTEPIGSILVPQRGNIPLYERLRAARKDIVMHLHFFTAREEGNAMSLSEDMSDAEIRRRIMLITKGFPASRLYFFTAEKALRSNARVAESVLAAGGFRKIETTQLSYVDRTSEVSNLTSRMNDLAASATAYGSAVGVLELQDGVMEFLKEEITRLRKKGFDFVSVRAALSQQ